MASRGVEFQSFSDLCTVNPEGLKVTSNTHLALALIAHPETVILQIWNEMYMNCLLPSNLMNLVNQPQFSDTVGDLSHASLLQGYAKDSHFNFARLHLMATYHVLNHICPQLCIYLQMGVLRLHLSYTCLQLY